MISPGTLEQAIQLAKQRWALICTHDLDDATWNDLFTTYKPGVVLQSIRCCKECHSRKPQDVYETLLIMCEHHSKQSPYSKN